MAGPRFGGPRGGRGGFGGRHTPGIGYNVGPSWSGRAGMGGPMMMGGFGGPNTPGIGYHVAPSWSHYHVSGGQLSSGGLSSSFSFKNTYRHYKKRYKLQKGDSRVGKFIAVANTCREFITQPFVNFRNSWAENKAIQAYKDERIPKEVFNERISVIQERRAWNSYRNGYITMAEYQKAMDSMENSLHVKSV